MWTENNSLYGNYRTRSFTDIFPDLATFIDNFDFWSTAGLNPEFKESNTKNIIYYLLYSRYGNSCIRSSDEDRFKCELMTIIYNYGPTWEKRKYIQQSLRDLTDDEVADGATSLINHASNPGTKLTNADDALLGVNDQSRIKYKKSKLEGFSILDQILKTDVTEEFIKKFKSLFLAVVMPQKPLWYETNVEEDI